MLQLPHHWLWDFWFARDGGRYHLFYLHAPKSLVDPDLRHWNARIGHAVSDDLRAWEVLGEALGPGPPGSWDDRATWTGCVIQHDRRWYLFYSGVSSADDGLVQRIGLATSEDLLSWRRHGPPLLEPDPRWYERLDLQTWIEETWRDPWVFREPDGSGWRMYVTARANQGPADGRGVVGQARSDDLLHWQVLPPLTEPGDFGHLEVPQVVHIGGVHYLIYSVYEWAYSAARLERENRACGTHYMIGESPLGRFRSPADDLLHGSPAGPFYAGKLITDADGRWVFLSWAQFGDDGAFIGALADPVPVRQHEDGRLSLERDPDLGDAELVREA